ncbi:SDR family NAD(P)-dependent oxidoreductase [Streptomyces sp. NPDC013178]|uniref:SDR family NAD(P)-dependent oxidoreductase n=1 Tax=Streptomyces sp. NPDC013178 TaxID=3155118 RepID=UPI0033EA98FE
MTQSLLDAKVAVVTGAETEIGAAIAAELARRGAAVAVQYHKDFARAKKVVRDLERAGGTAVAIKADLRDRAQIELMCKKAGGAFGDVDIVVATEPEHCAASASTSADPVGGIVDGVHGHLLAALRPMYAALPEMVGRGTGVLVYVGGAALPEPAAPDPVRAVARAAVTAALEQLAVEYGPFGVTTHILPATSAQHVVHNVALLAGDAAETGASA